MAEEETKIDEEAKQGLGDVSIKQIQQITSMIKNYVRALNGGTISSTELFILGSNTIVAGLNLISQSNDMDLLDVDTRISAMKTVQESMNQMFEKVYTNPQVTAGMVAQAAVQAANRDPKLKAFKGSKKQDA